MSEDGIVFGLALLGYTLLSTDLALRAGRRPIALLSVASALVATTHVGLVWTWRFEGSLTAALEGRAAGFVLFHGALLLMILTPFVSERGGRWTITMSFLAVSIGAIGATFKYDFVEHLRAPVIGIAAIAVFAAIYRYSRARAQATP